MQKKLVTGALLGFLLAYKQWGVISVSSNVNEILKVTLPVAYHSRFTIVAQHQYGDKSNTYLLFRRLEEISTSFANFSIFRLAKDSNLVGNMYWFSIGG